MKTHLNFAASDLEKSVAFYSTLLDAKPAKVRDGYALFIIDEPGMELALDLRERVRPFADAHYGIYVETAHEVERAIDRLQGAGLASSVEREETCCYANQTKVWAVDPDGRRWEVYTVHEDTEERNGADTSCCATARDVDR
ncbi:MAG TPA: ArsI/CadI family heavy metal resistance metalloenzyme [Candidatus Baltobacteraceae bacterium]|jgi:catechol 2,3-dioxygenase-like lactoylglutathione lyase family enzyme|nr:ArsI/CadI family heavy metal resistance metalloenzyme [Candidatus Baltobacteraceae bacterium]